MRAPAASLGRPCRPRQAAATFISEAGLVDGDDLRELLKQKQSLCLQLPPQASMFLVGGPQALKALACRSFAWLARWRGPH